MGLMTCHTDTCKAPAEEGHHHCRACLGANIWPGEEVAPCTSSLHSDTATAADILRAGLGHMEDRALTYDKPAGERSMAATVEAFKAVTGDGRVSSEERGWLFMVLLKLVRSQQGGLRMDSYEDGAAYCGLMGEAAAKDRGQ